MIFLIIFIILFVIFNHTDSFHRKIRKDTLQLKYACTEDMWFKKDGNKKLLICLHGMFSTPRTFEDLALVLVEEGWDVYIPALPASANTREELRTIGPWAWDESMLVINDKISDFSDKYQKTVLCGHSQGGSLAMQVATEKEFDALMILSSPIDLYGDHLLWWENIAVYLAGVLAFIVPNGLWLPIKNPDDRYLVEKCCDAEGIQYPYTIFTFKRGLGKLRPNLSKISKPLFLSYCKGDTLVNYKNLYKIKSSVSSDTIEEILYDISYDEEPYSFRHQLLNYTKTKDDLVNRIREFLKKI